jgi:hypothetical protein
MGIMIAFLLPMRRFWLGQFVLFLVFYFSSQAHAQRGATELEYRFVQIRYGYMNIEHSLNLLRSQYPENTSFEVRMFGQIPSIADAIIATNPQNDLALSLQQNRLHLEIENASKLYEHMFMKTSELNHRMTTEKNFQDKDGERGLEDLNMHLQYNLGQLARLASNPALSVDAKKQIEELNRSSEQIQMQMLEARGILTRRMLYRQNLVFKSTESGFPEDSIFIDKKEQKKSSPKNRYLELAKMNYMLRVSDQVSFFSTMAKPILENNSVECSSRPLPLLTRQAHEVDSWPKLLELICALNDSMVKREWRNSIFELPEHPANLGEVLRYDPKAQFLNELKFLGQTPDDAAVPYVNTLAKILESIDQTRQNVYEELSDKGGIYSSGKMLKTGSREDFQRRAQVFLKYFELERLKNLCIESGDGHQVKICPPSRSGSLTVLSDK